MAAVDAVKRMPDVLPQLSADSAQQLYPPTHGAADTDAHPVVAAIRTADDALGQRDIRGHGRVRPRPVRRCAHRSRGSDRRVVGQRARRSMGDGAEPSGRAVRPGSGQASVARGAHRSPRPLPSLLLAARSDMAGQQQHRHPSLHYRRAQLGSARPQHDCRLRLGRGGPYAHCEHPGHARRRGLERAVRRGRPDQASILRTRGAGSGVARGEQPPRRPRAGADPARRRSSRQRPRWSPDVRLDRRARQPIGRRPSHG